MLNNPGLFQSDGKLLNRYYNGVNDDNYFVQNNIQERGRTSHGIIGDSPSQ